MDTNLKICYTNGHETLWNQSTAGNPKTPGNCDVEGREDVSICRRDLKRFIKFGSAMAPNPSEKRTEGTKIEINSWPPRPALRSREKKAEIPTHQRASGRRIRHEYLDTQTHRSTDKKALWYSLSSGTHLEINVERFKLDLSKTRTPGYSTRRKSDCSLEKTNMATYKKTLGDLKRIWCSWTKAVSSSSPMLEKRGLLLAKRRFYDTAINVTEFPLFPVSLYLHVNTAWDSMSNFIPRTLPELKLFNTFSYCCGTCQGMWFFYGTVEQYIAAKLLLNFFCATKNSMFTDSPLMRQNLTLTNLSGPKQNALCPILHQKIYLNLAFICANHSGGFETRNLYFGHVSMLHNYRGIKFECIHYLCEGQ